MRRNRSVSSTGVNWVDRKVNASPPLPEVLNPVHAERNGPVRPSANAVRNSRRRLTLGPTAFTMSYTPRYDKGVAHLPG
jgi:hypothetical protein